MIKELNFFAKKHLPFIIVLGLLYIFGKGVFQLISLVITLYYWRENKWWVALLVTLPLYSIGIFISQQDFIPFPAPILGIISFVLSAIHLFPFLIDRLFYHKMPKTLGLLILPSLANISNLLLSGGPTGSMGYIANQLVDIKWLMQLTSIVGIFGIGFLMYLAATVLVHLIQSLKKGKIDKAVALISLILLSTIFFFGHYRINSGNEYLKNAKKVSVATIANEIGPFGESLYEAYTGEKIKIEKELPQTSPIIVEIQSALSYFKDNQEDESYSKVWKALDRQFESLMNDARRAVNKGAKIIVVAEAEVIVPKNKEKDYIDRVKQFSKVNQIYFFLGMGSLLPNVKYPANPTIENKIIVIDDQGEIQDVYLKNVPVKGIDPSVPGNGRMRILETQHGRLSYAICYDTDFPNLMRQVGKLNADILLVPAGDWKEISPYHTKTTNIRSIENGFAQVRAVRGGLSSAVDAFGNYLATDDYFHDNNHLMVVDIPIKSKATFFTKVGDLSSWFSLIILGLTVAYFIVNWFREKTSQ